MNRLGIIVFMAGLACLFPAQAQNVSVLSGNGQALVPSNLALVQPLVVQVKDANGNPVAGTTVNWQITSGGRP